MTQLETSPHEPSSKGSSQARSKLAGNPLYRALVLVLIGASTYVVIWEARVVWQEYKLLSAERAGVDSTVVVGYPGITPKVTFAERPRAWYRQEGESVLLWAGWVDGKGHRWYRAEPGDVDPSSLLMPHPVVIATAIDRPKVEIAGGKIWAAMPDEVTVVGQTLAGYQCVYPLPVLMRVEVVNDVVDKQPFVVAANIMSPAENPCAIFDARLDGHRVMMASSGYYQRKRPILYDRATQSLWMEQGDNLTAIAGTHKGKKLARVARPRPIAWRSWRTTNPRSRLVIGGDEPELAPAL
jgi:hypothetical protein